MRKPVERLYSTILPLKVPRPAAQGGSRDQKRCLGLRCGRFQKLRVCGCTLERLGHGKVDVGRRITSSVSIFGTALHRCFGPHALRADRVDPTLLGAAPLHAQTVCAVRRPAARPLMQRAIRSRFRAGLRGERRARGARGGHTGLASPPSRSLNAMEAVRLRCNVSAPCSESEELEEMRSIAPASSSWSRRRNSAARSWAKGGKNERRA